MNGLLINKAVLITGAGSGISLQMARTFAREGAAVVAADICGDKVQAAAEAIREEGGQAIGLACDVTSEEQVRSAIDKTARTFGTLHILVNNAGLQQVSPIEDFPVESSSICLRLC